VRQVLIFFSSPFVGELSDDVDQQIFLGRGQVFSLSSDEL
jgi:hypothetical protein